MDACCENKSSELTQLRERQELLSNLVDDGQAAFLSD